LLVATICLGQFMVVLDVSIVNVALASIGHDLDAHGLQLQWVVTAYTITFGGLLLVGARVGDLIGRRRALVGSALAFTVASVAAAFAPSFAFLIGARVAQGIAAAILSPATLGLLRTEFPEGAARRRILRIFSAVAGGGAVTGVLLGGLLSQSLSWHAIFLINVPIGASVIAGALLGLSNDRGHGAWARIGILNALAATLGISSVLWGLQEAGAAGFGRSSICALLVGACLLASFLALELRFSAAPLIAETLAALPNVVRANTLMLLQSAVFTPGLLIFSLYLQEVCGYDPGQTSLAAVPLILAAVVGAQCGFKLLPRFGAAPLLFVGPIVAAGCLIGMALLPSSTVLPVFAAVMALGFFALDMTWGPLIVGATAGNESAHSGALSGLFDSARQLGGSIGIAVTSTVAALVAGDGGGVNFYAAGFFVTAAFAVAMIVVAGRRPRRDLGAALDTVRSLP
jgi:MFS family permease